MMDPRRPNPDELLARVTSKENKSKRGQFRLFFGMSAGVGKTYAMLKAAHERKAEGVDVWIGLIETHGRPETEQLVRDIPIIPCKQALYGGTMQEEMDLASILMQRPELVLIDELAHSNLPGSRHEKRYQDVLEILDAGIDVYSTMNVQHLESRSDIVTLITSVPIKETVPDTVLERVDQIDLIDITPGELIERLKEGKVYPGRMTKRALENFFQESNLTALREIALRVTADKVELEMRDFHSPSTKKLLVAVSHSPYSERLIRTAKRTSQELHVPWIAVHVDTGKILDPRDHNQLIKNLTLAQEMGAETITLHGPNVANAINDFAKTTPIVQMIVGRNISTPSFWNRLRTPNIVGQIIRQNPSMDITILQQPNSHASTQNKKRSSYFTYVPRHPLKTTFLIACITLFNYFLNPYIGYRAVGFVFLFAIPVLGILMPFSSVLFASVLSAFLWNFLFIPPEGTLAIHAPEDIMMFIAYFVIALTTGFLTFQLHRNQNILREREERTRALYDILKSMTLVQDLQTLLSTAISKIEHLFNGECCVVLSFDSTLEEHPYLGSLTLTDNDRAVASWSFNNGRMAGWSTDTLSLSPVLCLTLKAGDKKLGVLAFKPHINKKLNPDQENLLISIVNQVGLVLAKQRYDEEMRQAVLVKKSEQLHQTLLNCISHELRTPLTAVMGAATALQSHSHTGQTPANLDILTDEIISASERLNHAFENLLNLTRLESSIISPKKEWFDFSDLVNETIDRQKRLLANHHIRRVFPSQPLYFLGDYGLLEQVITNLLLNAAAYSPPNTTITLSLQQFGLNLMFEVADEGPGLPEQHITHIFEKFYRIPDSPAGGLGLGLSICKNLTELHGGKIQARNNPEKGATFTVIFPYSQPPRHIQKATS